MFRNITIVVKNLAIINLIVFLVLNLAMIKGYEQILHFFLLFKSNAIIDHGNSGLFGSGDLFQPYQIVTHFFSHIEIWHIAFNMLALISIGSWVERIMGSRRFLEFYLFCGVVGGTMIAFLDPTVGPVLGASGAISGVLLAFALAFPNERLLIFFIPMKAKYMVGGIAAISLIFVVQSYFTIENSGGVSHFGHLAGMVAAAIYFGFLKLRRKLK